MPLPDKDSLINEINVLLSPLKSQKPGLLPRTSEIVTDFNLALEMSRAMKPEVGFECWIDLSANASTGLRNALFKSLSKPEFSSLFSLSTAVKKATCMPFLQTDLKAVTDFLDTDVQIILYSKCVQLVAPNRAEDALRFSKTLESAYSAGAVPCGWRGKWPDGNLMAYWLYTEQPQYQN